MKRTLNSSKSHHGCRRCKTRKLKCDEARPACRMCVKDGVDCPGYVPQLKWSRKHEKFDGAASGEEARANKSRRTAGSVPTSYGGTGGGVGQNDQQVDLATGENATDLHEVAGEASGPGVVQRDSPAAAAHLAPQDQSADLNAPSAVGHVNIPGDSQDHGSKQAAMFDWPLYDTGIPESSAYDQMSGWASLANDGSFAELTAVQLAMMCDNLDPHWQFPPDAWLGSAQTLSRESTLNIQESPSNAHTQKPTSLPTSNSASRTLLGSFYRLTTPSSVARFSEDDLVQHFFAEVCSLYSCIDSQSNPFRTLVKELLDSSRTIQLSIQSMAIAHLANHYLYMAPLGRIKRSQAWKSFQIDVRRHRDGKFPLDTILMSCLLLGPSSPWHFPADLGLQYLLIARNLLQSYLCNHQQHGQAVLRNERFYLDSFMHLEMLASFFEPVAMMSFPGYGGPEPPLPTGGEAVLVHPWVGVAPELHFALAEIGRMLRRRMSPAVVSNLDPPNIMERDEADLNWATSLEALVRSFQLPAAEAIVQYDDDKTPKSDLLRSAEAYSYVALLEIYLMFPDLLARRISREEPFTSPTAQGFISLGDLTGFAERQDPWLSAVVLHTLNLIRHISVSSAVSRMHLLVLVSAASQLRLPDNSTEPEGPDAILEMRGVVEDRMLALSRKYPQKQVLRVLDIIKEAWERLDRGDGCVHWLSIAFEQDLQTVLG